MNIHWLPLSRDLPYIQDAVQAAKNYNVSAFHLSHRLVHHADDIMNDSIRLSEVKQAVQLMKQENYDVWCWTHEIYHPPDVCVTDGKLHLEHPELEPHLKNKYDRLFKELLPGLNGLVLTFAETQYEVYKTRNVRSVHDGSPDEAARKTRTLVDLMHRICESGGRQLAIRDFVYRQHEIDAMRNAIGAVNDDVAVMSKCVPHDWQPYYPHNPVLGRVGAKQQWIEFDLGHEYEMQTALPFAEPELLLQRIRHARALGIETFCLRLDRYDGAIGNSAIYTPWGQLELLVFAMAAENPEVSLAQIRNRWEKEQFPGAWEVLELATEVVRRMLFPQKLWLANHSNLPSFNYARDHLRGGNADRLPIWTGSPVDRLHEALTDRPTRSWFEQLCQEDTKNKFYLERIDSILSDVLLEPGSVWVKGVEALHAWDELFRLYKRPYFAIRLLQNEPNVISRAEVEQWIDLLEQACERYKSRFPDFQLTGQPAWSAHPGVLESLRKQLAALPL